MTSLDSHDRACSAKNSWVLNEWCSTKIGRDTNGLKDTSSANHVRSSVEVEVVLAWLDWLRAGLGNGGHQLGNMSSLCATNSFQSRDLLWVEAESRKVGIWESGETLCVEVGFKMLKRQSTGYRLVNGFRFQSCRHTIGGCQYRSRPAAQELTLLEHPELLALPVPLGQALLVLALLGLERQVVQVRPVQLELEHQVVRELAQHLAHPVLPAQVPEE